MTIAKLFQSYLKIHIIVNSMDTVVIHFLELALVFGIPCHMNSDIATHRTVSRASLKTFLFQGTSELFHDISAS